MAIGRQNLDIFMEESEIIMKANKQEFNNERLLRSSEVGQILGVSKRTVHRYDTQGLIIKPYRIAGSVRYLKSELMDWIQAGAPDRKSWIELKQARRAG